MAYEVVTFSLRNGITDDSFESVLKEYIFDLLIEEAGVQRGYWGLELGNPRMVHIFVHWDSVEAHQELQRKDYYLPFVQKMGDIMDVEELQAFHTHLTPHPADHVLHSKSSPVTEIFLAYFPKDYSVANQQGFAESLESFLAKITPEAIAMTGFSGGWSLEERPIPGSPDSGKTYITCIGWTSVEAHEAFTKTQVFKDSQHLIYQADQLIQTEVVHYTGIRFK